MEPLLHVPRRSVRPARAAPPIRRALATLGAAAALALCLGACADDAGRAPADAPAAAAPDAARPAQRIVSLAPTFTETLIALGADDAIVGIGAYDPDVPGRPGVPRLGDSFTVSLEAVLALRPDLVVVNSKSVAEALRPAASRTVVLTPPTDRLDDALALVAELGRRTGREDRAAALRAEIDAAIAAARARADERRRAGRRAPKVLVVVQQRPLYAAGRTSFVGELLRIVGAENALEDVEQPWPALSEEAAVARAPDVILDASEGDNRTPEGRAALLAGWRRFPSVPAVRDGRVLVVREDAIFRAGPRIPEALSKLEAFLFPEDGRR